MTLFSIVFEMKELKRLFYLFYAAVVLLFVSSLVVVGLIDKPDFKFMKGVSNALLLFGLLFIVAFFQGQVSKKDLAGLRAFNDPESLFARYTLFYKRRLLLNLIPVFLCALLFVLTFSNTYFYLLVFQLLLSFVFFPRKAQVLRDLPGRDIVFD